MSMSALRFAANVIKRRMSFAISENESGLTMRKLSKWVPLPYAAYPEIVVHQNENSIFEMYIRSGIDKYAYNDLSRGKAQFGLNWYW